MESEERIYRVIISSSANDRMYEHFEFLGHVNVKAAEKLLESLLTDINSLTTMPFRNPVYNRPYLPAGKYRYMLSNKRYRIVYQISDDTIFVDDIQDCRQAEDKSIIR